MTIFLILSVVLLSFANGANDNFKGVATLWGSGLTTYQRAIAWGTGFTFLGSHGAIWLGSALAAKFSETKFVEASIAAQLPFLIAVVLGAGCTVLLAAGLGLPVSTTHSITGALVGAGVTAAGFSQVKFAALGKGVLLPLLFSPIVALVLTVAVQLLLNRFGWRKDINDCICVDEPKTLMIAPEFPQVPLLLLLRLPCVCPQSRNAKLAKKCCGSASLMGFTGFQALRSALRGG